MKVLLRSQIERTLPRSISASQAFVQQLADFVAIDILDSARPVPISSADCSTSMTGASPVSPSRHSSSTYQVVNSDIEAERDHLRVGDHYVRLLTMQEAITETRPLVLDKLLKI